jgi:uncharacterized protein (TIGR02466 family)
MFAIGIGVEKVFEGITPARKMFAENKKLFSPSTSKGHTTTLQKYGGNKSSTEHKNTASLKTIKDLIHIHGLTFLKDCGYDIINNDVEVTNIWLNEMESEAEHPQHTHYGSQVSGCFYVDVPKNSGGIMFSNPDSLMIFGLSNTQTYTIFNSATWLMNPEEGDMYFWRSDLRHQVLRTSFVGVRRSIAFDISVSRK